MSWSARSAREVLVRDAPALVSYLRETLPTLEYVDPDLGALRVREAAVLVPIFGHGGAPHLLFTVRSADLSSHRGEIAFPGGSRDPDDRSAEHTALRETEEELGVSRERVEILGPLPRVTAGGSGFLITPFVGWLGEGRPQLTPNPGEVAEVFDAPLSALDDPAIHHTELWQRLGQTHTIHFYDFGPYRIWGATGRMLFSLLALLPPS